MIIPEQLDLPIYLSIVFYTCVVFTLIQFYRIMNNSISPNKQIIIVLMVAWVILQSYMGGTDFYRKEPMGFPPRMLLSFGPTILLMLLIFLTKKGRRFVADLSLVDITWLNVVRIPVEFCLYWLFLSSTIPELMTFSGRNFDILAGLTAPIIAYYGLQKGQIARKYILIWNYLSLALLMFIVYNGILSAPTVLQKYAYDQPNIAILYSPYILLPALIVPVVLFGHLVSIYQLSNRKEIL